MDKEQSQTPSGNIMEALGHLHLAISKVDNKVDVQNETIKWIKESLEKTKTTLDEKEDYNEKKYAPKWIMIPLGVIASTLLVAVIGAIAGLILIPPVQSIALFYINLLC